MKISLSDTYIQHKATSKNKPQTDYFDAPTVGLALRVTQAGRKTWTFVYTSPEDGGRARITLGTYPATTLEQARIAAGAQRAIVESGKDPRNIVEVSFDKTVKELIEDRLNMEVREQLHPKTGAVVREALRSAADIENRYYKNVVPVVGDVMIKDFRILHFNRVVDPIKARGSLRMAGMVGADLKALFDFAEGRGEVDKNYIAKVPVDTGLKVKTTYLTTGEIKALWNALPTVFARSVAVQRILKLIMLTGCRVSEVAECTRDEFDMPNGLWTIPAARVKNGKKYGDFTLPLSEEALVIVREAMRDTNGDWLFPNKAGDGAIDNHVISTTIRRAQAGGKLGTKKWTPHDLRRTYVTQLLNAENAFGYVEFDVAVAVNHASTVKGTITGKYDQNLYLEKKRDVLAKWGGFITKLVNPSVQLMAAE